eukprot:TRINITY_DN28613_c1_g2_i1.p2 TRINITY_DN28613_c1_g2~~TRINITY_DN28613_c1_g2_i1.p2  ORF type:complete len:252 (+),score=52.99 TRINITY_DN28613_c1_g2_i1:72-758(+)
MAWALPPAGGARQEKRVRAEASEEGNRNGKLKDLKDVKVEKLPKDMQPLLRFLITASVMNLQDHRTVAGVLMDCIIVPTETAVAKALTETGRAYAEQCEAKGKGHDLGPPHLWAWAALVKALSTADVGAENKRCLLEHLAKYEGWSQEEAALHIRLVRLTKCFKSSQRKLWLCINEGTSASETAGTSKSLRRLVLDSLKQIEGCKVTTGRAPAGHVERELSEFLTRMG